MRILPEKMIHHSFRWVDWFRTRNWEGLVNCFFRIRKFILCRNSFCFEVLSRELDPISIDFFDLKTSVENRESFRLIGCRIMRTLHWPWLMSWFHSQIRRGFPKCPFEARSDGIAVIARYYRESWFISQQKQGWSFCEREKLDLKGSLRIRICWSEKNGSIGKESHNEVTKENYDRKVNSSRLY